MVKQEQHIIAIGGELHDSSATLLSGTGSIRWSVSEERLTRLKKDGRFPYAALEIIMSDDDRMVIAAPTRQQAIQQFRSAGIDPAEYAAFLDRLTFYDQRFPEAARIGHHEAHAASAYYTSGFPDAIIITMDGGSVYEPWSTTVYDGKLGTLKAREQSTACFTDCYFFTTALLGFTPNRHEGKITGLAAHGSVDKKAWDFFEKYDGTLANGISTWTRLESMALSPKQVLGKSAIEHYRTMLTDVTDEDMAATVQAYTEYMALEYIKEHAGDPVGKRIALAGGLFANVRLNQKVKELGFKEIFIHPGMGDEGLSMGAALSHLAATAGVTPVRLKNLFFGPEFSDDETEKTIEAYGLTYTRMCDPAKAIASLLADGHPVARYAGRMEYGPRALGNRTILYRTDDPTVNDWLNKKLQRTEFMPFAPATLIEHADAMYHGVGPGRYSAEFMTITFDCTPAMKRISPGVVHVDGTARPQLVSEDTNPGLYTIIQEYHMLTGTPSVINTSFNSHGEPIVCTPTDAIDSFIKSTLPYLAIGGFLVEGPR